MRNGCYYVYRLGFFYLVPALYFNASLHYQLTMKWLPEAC